MQKHRFLKCKILNNLCRALQCKQEILLLSLINLGKWLTYCLLFFHSCVALACLSSVYHFANSKSRNRHKFYFSIVFKVHPYYSVTSTNLLSNSNEHLEILVLPQALHLVSITYNKKHLNLKCLKNKGIPYNKNMHLDINAVINLITGRNSIKTAD